MSVSTKQVVQANVLSHCPTDGEYLYSMIRSYWRGVELHPTEGQVTTLHMAFKNIVGARNLAVKSLLEGNFTHLLFIDSDQVIPEYTLSRLLQHDVDVVGGLYCRKLSPHTPLAFTMKQDGFYWFFPEKSLVECDAIATGCMLIKREVFSKITPPWFYYEPSPNKHNYWETTTEDMTFCKRLREAGIKVHIDGSLHIGHIGQCVVWPKDKQSARIETYGQGGSL